MEIYKNLSLKLMYENFYIFVKHESLKLIKCLQMFPIKYLLALT